ncbi:AAA-ATPase ASD, mitochondrial, partial [Mucuna pruriens]
MASSGKLLEVNEKETRIETIVRESIIRKMGMGSEWSVLGTLTASIMIGYTVFDKFIPNHIRSYFLIYIHKLIGFLSPYIQITFPEFSGERLKRSELFSAIQTYLIEKSSQRARKLKAEPAGDSHSPFLLSMDDNEEITDTFQEAKLWWGSHKISFKTQSISFYPTPDEKRFYTLTFHKRHRDLIAASYIPHVLEQGKSIKLMNRQLKLYTNDCSTGWGGYRKSKWSHVVFEHPARFETLAMEENMKKEIIDDLDTFKNGKEYYDKIGKAWKRGYLLYGPPGTGKSTMISAMANYLYYDVYDLELTAVKDNTQLRTLLIETTSKSIIVIEDIDCSLNLTGKRVVKKEKKEKGEEVKDPVKKVDEEESKVTLSGLLNCIDGIWSGCAGERIIIFTTNYVDKLDPALIRSGRMDKKIELSYCCYEAFKVLAQNYLDVAYHALFPIVEGLLKETNMTPADVAENMMPKSKSDDVEVCLKKLIESLEKAKKKAEEEEKEKEKEKEKEQLGIREEVKSDGETEKEVKENVCEMGELWTQMGSLMATIMFVYAIVERFFPAALRDTLQIHTQKVVNVLYPYVQITFPEFSGERLKRSEAYTAIQTYLSENSSQLAKRLKAEVVKDSQNPLVLSMDDDEEVIDEFQGVKLWWAASKTASNPHAPYSFSYYSPPDGRRYFKLTFHKKHRDLITVSYIKHVLEEGKEIALRNRQRKLYTNNPSSGWYGYKQSKWSHIVFEHPATFETLAMEQRKKEEIINDLVKFRNGKDYYAKIGKAWKRGYLLYGPPGTGKSTMIAAMANFMNYDVYDLELTAVKDNTELRKLLIETSSKAIIVVEDIDCSLDLTGQRNMRRERGEEEEPKDPGKKDEEESNKSSKVTLSGLLNFIDGIWSACGGERIIIFTTNFVDKLDPALIRTGRMDKHIELSYCRFEAFKVLAKNYLDVHSHHLFPTIANLLEVANVTPADVAENLMPKSVNEDQETCLFNLIQALQMAKEEAGLNEENDKQENKNNGHTMEDVKENGFIL